MTPIIKMSKPLKELSHERCNQLRKPGILCVIANLLHEHTFELQNKRLDSIDMELFLMDFNGKAELRARLSHQLRTIVKHTATNEDELKILGTLEGLRKYIDRLYNFIVGWKTMTEDSRKLSELSDLAGEVKKAIKGLRTLTADDETRLFFEEFGGFFVIVDYLRVQMRFNTKCHQFQSDLIDTPQFLAVANDSRLVLRHAVDILCNLVAPIDSNDDIRLILGNSRSLHKMMGSIVEDAYHGDDLRTVRVYSYLLHSLYRSSHPIEVRPSTSHLKNCRVIKFLTKFSMAIKHPKTLCNVLEALERPLFLNRRNFLEFAFIDGSVNKLIDVLVPSNEKDDDVKNAKWYKKQQHCSTMILAIVNARLSSQDHINGGLLALYQSRDFAAILVHHLEQVTSIHEYSETTKFHLDMLVTNLLHSDDQPQKFKEMTKRVVKKFESSDKEHYVRLSKQIGEMLE